MKPVEALEIERLLRMNRNNLRVPLSWVATTEAQPFTNFGDGLSAVVVSAIAGVPAERANFDEARERLVAVGTIGHGQKNGIVHFWGTGIDATRNPLTGAGAYFLPPDTEFHVHATRGPRTAATFRNAGLAAPEIYGDPVWLLPRIWPLDDVEKTHDLGIILHISELESETAEAAVRAEYLRYQLPDEWRNRVRIINTYTNANAGAIRDKVREIVSCRRILSTSLHGLVISETYGIPCAWFATRGPGEGVKIDLNDPEADVDHRIHDFYQGIGAGKLLAYCRDRKFRTNWADTIRFIDKNWKRVTRYDGRALLEAFPLPMAVSASDTRWAVDKSVLERIPF